VETQHSKVFIWRSSKYEFLGGEWRFYPEKWRLKCWFWCKTHVISTWSTNLRNGSPLWFVSNCLVTRLDSPINRKRGREHFSGRQVAHRSWFLGWSLGSEELWKKMFRKKHGDVAVEQQDFIKHIRIWIDMDIYIIIHTYIYIYVYIWVVPHRDLSIFIPAKILCGVCGGLYIELVNQ
jgi:hypothetical protein